MTQMRLMKAIGFRGDDKALRIAISVSAVAAAIVGLVLAASLLARPVNMLQFEHTQNGSLAADADIDGHAAFDKESYFAGESALYELRVVYRSEVVTPEFDGFANRVNHHPFEQLDMKQSFADIGDGLTEYRLQYKLQVLNPARLGRYEFNPAVLYYETTDAPGEMKSTRIDQPVVYLSSYYPPHIEMMDLFGLKGPLNEWVTLRSAFLFVGALTFLSSAFFLLRQLGYRRSAAELSTAEAIWRDHESLQDAQLTNRQYLARCERMFTTLFQTYARVSPRLFWSGGEVPDDAWAKVGTQARPALRKIYQAKDPDDQDVSLVRQLLRSILSPLVEEARLRREQEPSLMARLAQRPGTLRAAGILSLASLILLILCAVPSAWLHADVSRYNEAVRMISRPGSGAEDAYVLLSAVGSTAQVEKVKAAALYNAGTFLADRGFANVTAAEQKRLLELVYEARTVEELLQTMLLSGIVNSQEEAVTVLIRGAEQLRKAELDLELATRIVPDEETMLRNLELIARRRHALLLRLSQLRELFSAGVEDESGDPATEGLVNIIDAELPEEYKKEDMPPGEQPYMIFERF